MIKRRLVALSLLGAVLLCGCEKGDKKPETVKAIPQTKMVSYTEQSYDCSPAEIYGENRVLQFHFPQMSGDEKMYQIVQEYDTKEDFCISKTEFAEGKWKAVEVPWVEKLDMFNEKKNTELEKYQYIGDDLYLYFVEYSMNPPKYYNNSEKYKDKFWAKAHYFVKVNETTNDVTEIKIPTVTYKEYFERKYPGEKVPSDVSESEILISVPEVMTNGDYFLSSMDSGICGVYSGTTGEKLEEGVDISGYAMYYSDLLAGDEFLAIGVGNDETNQVEVNVYDKTGKLLYTLPTGIDFDHEKIKAGEYDYIQLGVEENTILLATSKGIYEAEFEDDEFTQVIDAEKENFYYLSSEFLLCANVEIMRGNDNDYYIVTRKAKMSDQDRYYLCHYKKG